MRYFNLKSVFSTVGLILFFAQSSFSQCDPATAAHYNDGDFPFISTSGVTVTQSGTFSQLAGPYAYACGGVEANSFTVYPGDDLIFTFSQAITELTFVAGAMNASENGEVTTNNGIPTLTTSCAEISITGNAFIDVGVLTSAPITISIPAGATEITISDLPAASTNGYYTIDILDCITPGNPCTPSTSNLTVSECIEYISPSGNVYNVTEIFNDTIPNASGCDSVITIDLTIVGINNTVNNLGDQLTALQSPAIYQWLDCENSYAIINGENGQTFFPSSNGLYAVQITQDNCIDTSACESISIIGIDELEESNVKIFPNPTEGKVNIVLNKTNEVHVTVRSITGQIVNELNYNTVTKFELDLVGPKGIYFIEIDIANQEKKNYKVIKQ